MEHTIYERASQLRCWVRSRQLAAIHLISLLVSFFTRRRLQYKSVNLPTRELRFHRQKVREEIMNNISSSGKARKIIRMNISAFSKLCNILVKDGGLQPTKRMSVEEQVARFLHIVGNDLRNRMISWVYHRSESSTSRSFHRVLRAIMALEDHYLQQPSGQIIAKEIREKSRFYPYFKDCVGAIDGTHVRVKVSNKDAPRYRGRKGYPTINVLASCTFDLRFTYVLTGWEGTASDSRIIKDALAKPDAIKWKTKKIYNYNELSELFSKDRATGAAAGTAKEKNKQYSKTTFEQPETLEEVDRLLSTNKVTLESLIVDEDVFVSSMPSSEEVQMNSNSSKNKKRKREEEEEMSSKIMASLEVVGEAIKEGNAILKDINIIMERSRQRVYNGEEIYNELELMDLEPKIISKAYLFLIKNQDSAQALFGCPTRVRKSILDELIGRDASP